VVGGSLQVLRLLQPIKNGRHDITEILVKVALNTQNQSKCDSRTYLIVCVLLKVQRCIPHVYSGQEQVPQYDNKYMVFNDTFNNISDISWRSASLLEEYPEKITDLPQVTKKLHFIT